MTRSVQVGDLVVSTAGHDKGRALVVIEIVDEQYVLVCDGVTRRLEKLKRKKGKHLKPIAADRMETVTSANLLNADVRKFIEAQGYATDRK